MIRKPWWVHEKLGDAAHDILNDQATITDAAEELAGKIVANDKPFTIVIVADKCRQWLKQEMTSLVRAATKITNDEESTGQEALMPLPFPWLPAYLEVAPGRTVHQRVMTGPDMDRAKAIWQNRRDQAELGYRGFERAYELVRSLLADDVTTVADVVDELRLDYGEDEGFGTR